MMLEAIAGRLGIKVGKGVVIALALAALLATAGLAVWRGLAVINHMERRARDTAIAERDAHWKAEIAASNALVEVERRRSAEAALAAEQRAAAEIQTLQSKLVELEAANAALPNGAARGLGRDRVRLLNR